MGLPPKDLQKDSVFSRFLPATATLLTPLAFSALITKTPTCPVPRRRMRRSSNPPKVSSANLSAAEPIVVGGRVVLGSKKYFDPIACLENYRLANLTDSMKVSVEPA